jgi:osmoprotectant transport system ATP-binding protein
MIELAGVGKCYRGTWAVRGLDLSIADGELVAVLGESGSGKTTLLKMINRLIDADEGTVRVDGRDVRDVDAVTLRRSIGYVIQQVGLLPHLSVADNIALVPSLLGWDDARKQTRVAELLALVALPDVGARFPDELSGGQRQRVGLARALAARPRLLLLDEPFGALDPITRVSLRAEVTKLHRDLKLTTVMVTHDIVEAMTMADRIAVLYRSELRQVGTPAELIAMPADDYVAKLIGMAKHQAAELERVTA